MQCDKNMHLVKSIEKFPCLYNSNLIDYLRKDVTDEAWHVVAHETQLSVSECKEKWKNLRYGLLRSLRINPDGTAKKKYYLYDEMEFLLPFMKTSKHETILHTIDETVLDMNIENVVNEQDEFTSVQPSHHQSFEISEPSKKRLRPNDLLTKKSHQTSTHVLNYDGDDSRKMFLLSLLPEVHTLTELQMRVFRRKVLTLIDEIGDSPSQYETCMPECHKDSDNEELEEPEINSHNDLIKKEPA